MFSGASIMSTYNNNNNNSSAHCLSDEAATCSNVSSVTRVQDFPSLNPLISANISPTSDQHPDHKIKKKRNLPGNPDPDAEVIALSPKTLMATNRFVCEICNKGFQRDQNLQLHRRGHNLPWKLKQRNSKDIMKKKAYVCPEITCVHHHPSRALGDLTGIKKHFCRKHGEKKWKCDKCSKIYAVQSDWKAHSKTCGTREYRCDCGTLFSRKDSFITHRAFCDALAEESARLSAAAAASSSNPIFLTSAPLNPNISQSSPFTTHNSPNYPFTTTQLNGNGNFPNPPPPPPLPLLPWEIPNPNPTPTGNIIKPEIITLPPLSSPFYQETPSTATTHKNFSPFLHHLSTSAPPHLSATALLQRAATVGSQPVGHVPSTMMTMGEQLGGCHVLPEYMANFGTWQKSDRLTRDFLGLTAGEHGGGAGAGDNGNVDVNVNVNVRNLLTFTGDVGGGFPTYERDQSLMLKPHGHGFGFAEPPSASGTWGNC